MRYRVTAYTISGQTITLTGIESVTVADVRLIVDETAKKVICSSMQKGNISCSTNVITVDSSVASLDASHAYTIVLDFGEQPSALAKEASVKYGNDTAISVAKDVQDKVGTSADDSGATTLFGQLKAIKNLVGECTLEQNNDGEDTYTLILDRMAIIQGETVEIL